VTDEVKFTDAQWDELARAAEAFAKVLEDENGRLKDAVSTNWAGNCAEGLGLIDNLRQLLYGDGSNSFSDAILSEAEFLRGLSRQCSNAKETLVSQDEQAISRFSGAS
jgi:hypothetical protein